ncbi:MAG TPA: flagellar hook-length control protein FliK [Candidatus Hydrogenedentes bacterium]|nr:flagellar hook-length control protein FliK [Candidatus Hydrogenedentota bacterium]HNT88004.1 flagellar hook-length control protein FliK [Candidatus Hydrogenedentota bacterium]
MLDGISSLIPIARHHVLASALRAGQTFRATVHGTGDQPVLLLAGARIPIEGGARLTPGQTVHIEVVDSNAGLALRVLPGETPSGNVAASPDAALRAALAEVLHAMGAARHADAAEAIVPRFLPPSSLVLRQLLALFFERGALGADLDRIQQWVAQAAAAGAAPRPTAENVLAMLAALAAGDVRAFADALERLARARGLEARLANLATGDAEAAEGLDDFLTAYLSRLAAHEPFRQFLRANGALRGFEAAARRIQERLDGVAVQNLRGLEQPYVFLELPLPADAALRHVQVHFIGTGRGRRFEKDNALIVIDVSTARLGDLWVTLSMVNGACRCGFRATDARAVEAIRANAGELAEALRDAGYPRAHVEAALWDGDRLRETAALMRRFGGLDVKG